LGFPTSWSFTTHKDSCWGTKNNLLHQLAINATTAAKVNAEKSAKLVLAKAKKAEKDLANANKEHLQREQAVAERLNQMSAAAGGTYYTIFYFVGFLALLCLLMYSFSAVLLFPWFCRI
jgi:hypothetical protein